MNGLSSALELLDSPLPYLFESILSVGSCDPWMSRSFPSSVIAPSSPVSPRRRASKNLSRLSSLIINPEAAAVLSPFALKGSGESQNGS